MRMRALVLGPVLGLLALLMGPWGPVAHADSVATVSSVADAGAWSRPRTLEPRTDVVAFQPRFATNRSGQAAVVWLTHARATTEDGRPVHQEVRVRRVSRQGRLGPVRTVHRTGGMLTNARVVMDAQGNLLVGWEEDLNDLGWRTFVRRVPRAGQAAPARAVWTEGEDGGLYQIAMTPAGAGAVAWLHPKTIGGETAPPDLLFRRVRGDGSLSPVTHLGMTGGMTTLVAGERSFWSAGIVDPYSGSGSDGGIGVVRVDRRGRVAARRTLAPAVDPDDPTARGSAPRLTVDDHGDVRVVWTSTHLDEAGAQVAARVWRADGSLGRRTVLKAGDVGPLTLATDPSGDSFVTWISTNGPGFEGFGRRWDRRGRRGPVQHFGPVAASVVLGYTEVHGPDAWLDGRGRGLVTWGLGPDGSERITRVQRLRPDGTTRRLPSIPHGTYDAAALTSAGRFLATYQVGTELHLVTGP